MDKKSQFKTYSSETKEFISEYFTIDKYFFGKFPIMLQSNMCLMKGLEPNARFYMGECKNDYGGYFIIDGKEKIIVVKKNLQITCFT